MALRRLHTGGIRNAADDPPMGETVLAKLDEQERREAEQVLAERLVRRTARDDTDCDFLLGVLGLDGGVPEPEPQEIHGHGTEACYERGCRSASCTSAHDARQAAAS